MPKQTDTQTTTTTGVKPAATLTKAPEYGFTATVRVAGGTATATVQLRAWVESGAKEVLASFTLPATATGKVGDLYDTAVVAATYDGFDWNVTALGSGATLTLTVVGVGI